MFDGVRFMARLGPGVVWVIYSSHAAASAIWNSLLRLLSPHSLQRGGNSYTRPGAALPSVGRDNTHVSAFSAGLRRGDCVEGAQ